MEKLSQFVTMLISICKNSNNIFLLIGCHTVTDNTDSESRRRNQTSKWEKKSLKYLQRTMDICPHIKKNKHMDYPRFIGPDTFQCTKWSAYMFEHLQSVQIFIIAKTAEVGNILSWRLIMKYFLRSFSPFHCFKKGSCQFLAKECAQYWLTA